MKKKNFEESLVGKDDNARFEEPYFEGYYKGIGNFTKERDKEIANWFRGIFGYIDKYCSLKKENGKRLIEFGCATGAAASVLSSYGWKVTATDISKYAVERAKKNYDNITFKVQNMENPYIGAKFDAAVAFDVIEHLRNPNKGIRNVYNLLKKNGITIFTTPNDYPHVYNDPTHINVKKPHKWMKILKEAGFKEIFVKQVAIMPYFYRWSYRLAFVFPFAVNFKYVISPVILIARK